MPRSRPFIQCDVFTSIPTRGNALAVVLDAKGLTDETMMAFAAWTNLAETTFLLPAEEDNVDYHLRIFTPQREMPFAGHPTLGSCAAWLKQGGKPKDPITVRQKCGIGIVEISLNGDVPAFVAPPTTIKAMPEIIKEKLAQKLQIDSNSIIDTAILNNGPIWQAFKLASAADVLAIDSSKVRWPEEKAIGLIGPYPESSECAYEVRMLAPSSGMSEDPITGSLNSALAHWLESQQKLTDSIVISQGTKIERTGRVYISRDSTNTERILIGGESHILIEGSVML